MSELLKIAESIDHFWRQGGRLVSVEGEGEGREEGELERGGNNEMCTHMTATQVVKSCTDKE